MYVLATHFHIVRLFGLDLALIITHYKTIVNASVKFDGKM